MLQDWPGQARPGQFIKVLCGQKNLCRSFSSFGLIENEESTNEVKITAAGMALYLGGSGLERAGWKVVIINTQKDGELLRENRTEILPRALVH